MKSKITHEWDVTPQEAIAIQENLRRQIVSEDRFTEVQHIAGVDVGFEGNGKITRAAVVLLDYPELDLREQSIARRPTTFPYVPGLLSFREVPAILDALEEIRGTIDLLVCDGHGFAHPRRFGLACHLGLLANIPTIGVAKSRLVGKYDPVGLNRGDQQALIDGDELIGMVLRTRSNVKPVFVSTGHMVSLKSALSWVLSCGGKYRLPEPIRQAHRLASNKSSSKKYTAASAQTTRS